MTEGFLPQAIQYADDKVAAAFREISKGQRTYLGQVTSVDEIGGGVIRVRVARRNRMCQYSLPFDVAVGDWVTVQSAISTTDLWHVLSWNSNAEGIIVPTISDEAGHKHVVGEDMTDEVDGTNTTFMTEYEFLEDSEAIYCNGIRQRRDFTYTPTVPMTIEFTTAPCTGSVVLADYIIGDYNCGWGVGPWSVMPWGC